MSMLKKLLPAILGALLVASPVIAITTAAAAPQAQTSTMKSHHKATKHKKASHHAKHSKKAKKTPPKA
jgi:Ni/Co efflux regulator RcnB